MPFVLKLKVSDTLKKKIKSIIKPCKNMCMPTFLSLLVMCRITQWKYQGTKTPQAWSVSGQPQGNASGWEHVGARMNVMQINHIWVMETVYSYPVLHCFKAFWPLVPHFLHLKPLLSMLDSHYQLYLTDEETETKQQPNITWLHGGWGWTKSGHFVSQFIHWFYLQSKDLR